MQTLCHLTLLTRVVLAWFVLSLGVAVASPLLKPLEAMMVCTGSGAMMMQPSPDDGSPGEGSSTQECPMCVLLNAAPPPPVVRVALEPHQPLSYALQGIASAHIAARTAAPLPARGPPHRS